MKQKRNDFEDNKNECVVDKCDNRTNITTRYPLNEYDIRRYHHHDPNSIDRNL